MAHAPSFCYRACMSHACQAFVICSNPRSGTTLLCDMLAQTGVTGQPDSFFREKSLADWCEAWDVAGPIDRTAVAFTERYFAAMRQAGRGQSDLFGLRLMGPDLALARAWLTVACPDQTDDTARFDAAFGSTRFIHLSRRDKLAEAVSYLRAEQTGLWHQKPDGSVLEQVAPTVPAGYDEAALSERLQMLSAYDDAWPAWFDAQGIAPLRISYEGLSKDPVGCLKDVLRFLGQDPAHADKVRPGVRKLGDAVNAAWIQRYRKSHPDA